MRRHIRTHILHLPPVMSDLSNISGLLATEQGVWWSGTEVPSCNCQRLYLWQYSFYFQDPAQVDWHVFFFFFFFGRHDRYESFWIIGWAQNPPTFTAHEDVHVRVIKVHFVSIKVSTFRSSCGARVLFWDEKAIPIRDVVVLLTITRH